MKRKGPKQRIEWCEMLKVVKREIRKCIRKFDKRLAEEMIERKRGRQGK